MRYAGCLMVTLTRVALLALTLSVAAPPAVALPTDPVPTPPAGPHERVPEALEPAVAALRKGDAATALTLARTFVKGHPDSAVGHEVVGEAARQRQQWAEAEKALTEAVRLEPGRGSALFRLGYLALQTRDAKKAEQRFRQAIAAAPQFGLAYRGLASALARQGNLGGAIGAAEQAVRVSGDQDPEARADLAKLYYDTGRLLDAERLLTETLALRPELASALVLQGLVKLDLGKTDESGDLFDRVIARDPGSTWGRLGHAVVQRVRGQLPAARAELEKLVKENPDWAQAHVELGHTLLLQRQRDAALKAFDRAERAAGDPGLARVQTARLLLARGHPDLAIDRAQSLLANQAVAGAARAILVQAYLVQKSPQEAERVLREAVAAAPQDTVAMLNLGRFYAAQGRARDALAQFDRAVAARPDSAELLVPKAETHAMLGETGPALAAAERIVELQGKSPDSYLFLAAIQERLGRNAEAVQAYRQALTKEPKHLGALRGLAALHRREGRAAESVKLLQEAAGAHPTSPIPLMDLAQVFEAKGDRSEAVASYREALKRAPDEPVLLNNLAYLLAMNPATLAEAATLSERAYKQVPRNPSIADTHGWILFRQGAVDRALPLLEQAARQAPANPEIQYHLGAVYARLGRRDDARRALEQALQRPQFADAGEARKLLESLR
jgi:tetratricopeptide (TPR) repeat protein